MGFIDRLRSSMPGRVILRFAAADAGLYGAVIAYSAVFAMFPIMLVILTILGLVLRDPFLFDRFGGVIVGLFPQDIAGEAILVLRDIREGGGLLGIVSFVGLLWAGHTLFSALAVAFNRVYGVPNRPMLRQLLLGVSMIFLFAVLFVISSAATAVAQFLLDFAGQLPIAALPGFELLGPVVSYLVSFAAALVLFLTIYYVVPNVKLTWAEVWPGSLLTAVLFVLVLQIFPLYVRWFGQFGRFGSLFGFLFLLLTWLNFVGQVILLGASLNAVLHHHPEPKIQR